MAELPRGLYWASPHGGGGAGTGPFTPTPPPPSLLGFGWEVRPKENLLDLVEGEKMGFHFMYLYSKYCFF